MGIIADCAWGTYASLEVYASVADVSSYLALQAEVDSDYFVSPGAQFMNFEIVYPRFETSLFRFGRYV
jgi:hypothetical protein